MNKESLILFVKRQYFLSKSYNKLNKYGEYYLDYLINNFQGSNEFEFNKWTSEIKKPQPINKTQAILAESIIVSYLVYLNS